MDEIKIGDIVISDTKGPRMLVIAMDSEGNYECEWYRWTGLRQSAWFTRNALTKNAEDQ